MGNLFERLARGRPAEAMVKQPHKDPAQLLLDFLQRWPRTTISSRDIRVYGPKAIRDRESAIRSAQILAAHGWLVPHQTRPDRHQWEIVRRPRSTVAQNI